MILRRAFAREVLHTAAAVSAILLAIFLFTRLVDFLRQAADGDIPIHSVLLLLLLKMVGYLDIIVPLTLYVSVLFVLGRWSRDNELTAFNACGMGITQMCKPAMTLAVLVGALVALFSLYLTPLSIEAARVISHPTHTASAASAGLGGVGNLDDSANLAQVRTGVFNEIEIRARDDATGQNEVSGVYFIEARAPDGTLRDLFVYAKAGADAEVFEHEIVAAEVGRKITGTEGLGPGSGFGTTTADHNAHFLLLQNGRRYRATPGAREYAVLDFQTYRLRLKPRSIGVRKLPMKAMPTHALFAWAMDGAPSAVHAELHWRIAKVLMPPILLLLALSFSALSYRKARFPGMLPALLLYFAYSNALAFGVALIKRGAFAPHLPLYVVHAVFLALALYLLYRRARNQRALPNFLSWRFA